MKNGWILAVILIVIGIGLLMAVGVFTDFDLRNLSTGKAMENHTYTIDEPVSSVLVSDTFCDLRLLPAEDGVCTAVCSENEDFYCDVTVQNGTLTITRRDKEKWYAKIGIFTADNQGSVIVYLPEGIYDSLELSTASGDITLEPGLQARQVTIGSTSGDLELSGLTAKSVELSTTSGDQALKQMTADTLLASSVSGDFRLDQCSFGSLTLNTTSGELSLTDSLCSGFAQISTTSGDIRFTRFDAGSMEISSTSGDVTGTLLTGKDFETNTVSGEVWVKAYDSTGGKCSINTVSGEIHLDLAS